MGIDQILINYFYDYGDTLEGLLFVNDNPGENITRISVDPHKETIEFYQGDELIKTIEVNEMDNINVGTNYIDKHIAHKNKVIFELKGYNIIRLYMDLKFDSIVHS